MNKKITFLTVTAIMAIFMSVTSCKKASNNTDQLATLGKATITGKVTAALVDTFGAGMQNAPAGTVINAWIDTRDLVLNPNGGTTYAKKYYTTTVTATGDYTLTIDVSMYQPAVVHIMPAQFTYNQVYYGPSGLTSARKVYNANPAADVSVSNGVAAIEDISYN